VETKILQWSMSTHAIGGNYERNGTSCAPCHTSQGFKEVVETGAMETAADIADPSNINCYTCHFIHDTYTVDDWGLRTTDPVTLWIDESITLDLGNANLCANCHQPRSSYEIPDVNNPDGTYEVTSSRFGPHHGPQSTVLTGNAFYMVGSGYSNSMHADIENGCIQCHMAEPYGSQGGGHTFSMTYEYHGDLAVWAAGCLECHGDEDALHEEVEEWEAEFEALATELGTLLFKEGIITETGSAVPGTYTNRVAGACWNFRTLTIEDRSKGMHNPKMAKKILENSIASLQE
jgi:formate-dependent nitrite reductase cytochrome c552 subunit